MAKSVSKKIHSAYNRLKKAMDNILTPKKDKSLSQLILQPVRIPTQRNK